jgi:hypothetical protein
MSGFNALGAGKDRNAPKAVSTWRFITTQKERKALLVSPMERRRSAKI